MNSNLPVLTANVSDPIRPIQYGNTSREACIHDGKKMKQKKKRKRNKKQEAGKKIKNLRVTQVHKNRKIVPRHTDLTCPIYLIY